MANEHDNGGDKTPRADKSSFDETVEQVKQTLIHGAGYRNPPRHTRFKKGRSGNPKGRPKSYEGHNTRSANAIALKEAERSIGIREGTETREMTAIDAVVRKQFATALGGNAYAQKHVIDRYHWAERERREKIAEECELGLKYIEKTRTEMAECKAKGLPCPDPLPHPDDVVIDPVKGVRLVGPFTEDGRALIGENKRFRDVLIMQDVLDTRMAGEVDNAKRFDRPGTALAFAFVINDGLPERHRLSTNEFILGMMRYDSWSKRKLLKEVYRAWRTAGVHPRRGCTFPPLSFAHQKFNEIRDVLDQGHEEIMQAAALSVGVQIEALAVARQNKRRGE